MSVVEYRVMSDILYMTHEEPAVLNLRQYALLAHHVGSCFETVKRRLAGRFQIAEKRELTCIEPPHLREVRSM